MLKNPLFKIPEIGLEYALVVERLPSMHKALGSIPAHTEKKDKERKTPKFQKYLSYK
jgi:hypothetical protein